MIEVTSKDYNLHVPGEKTPRQLTAREFAHREGARIRCVRTRVTG
jgi:hypothetical protein